MAIIMNRLIKRQVDQLFAKLKATRGECCINPITAGGFVKGLDPIAEQKVDAVVALLAQEWFEVNGPPDAPLLPLNVHDRDRFNFALDLWDEWGEIFTVMAGLGFFRQTGERYQMTLPQEINGPMIEDALLKLAVTEDEDSYLQPEDLVSCLTKTNADMWQDLLERLPWMERVADRALLLEEI
jgi:hypothetical protein